MKKSIRKAVKRAVSAERDAWRRAAERVINRHEGMGLRHDAARAQGAKDILTAMGFVRRPLPAHSVQHVSGLTPVMESY